MGASFPAHKAQLLIWMRSVLHWVPSLAIRWPSDALLCFELRILLTRQIQEAGTNPPTTNPFLKLPPLIEHSLHASESSSLGESLSSCTSCPLVS
jgi:hypothetical protein